MEAVTAVRHTKRSVRQEEKMGRKICAFFPFLGGIEGRI
jgi:hypothetical protein